MPPPAGSLRACARPRSKPTSRSTTERQVAMSVYEETMKLSESCT